MKAKQTKNPIRTSLVPFDPKPGPRRTIQTTLDAALVVEAEKASKADGRSLREVVEWGLKEYLAHNQPTSLQKLGVELNPPA